MPRNSVAPSPGSVPPVSNPHVTRLKHPPVVTAPARLPIPADMLETFLAGHGALDCSAAPSEKWPTWVTDVFARRGFARDTCWTVESRAILLQREVEPASTPGPYHVLVARIRAAIGYEHVCLGGASALRSLAKNPAPLLVTAVTFEDLREGHASLPHVLSAAWALKSATTFGNHAPFRQNSVWHGSVGIDRAARGFGQLDADVSELLGRLGYSSAATEITHRRKELLTSSGGIYTAFLDLLAFPSPEPIVVPEALAAESTDRLREEVMSIFDRHSASLRARSIDLTQTRVGFNDAVRLAIEARERLRLATELPPYGFCPEHGVVELRRPDGWSRTLARGAHRAEFSVCAGRVPVAN